MHCSHTVLQGDFELADETRHIPRSDKRAALTRRGHPNNHLLYIRRAVNRHQFNFRVGEGKNAEQFIGKALADCRDTLEIEDNNAKLFKTAGDTLRL